MSLRKRIVWYLSVVVLLYAGMDHLLQKQTFMKRFTTLEEQSARSDVNRVVEVIDREKEHLASRCVNLASWDEMYRYVLERDKNFVQANLDPEIMARDSLNLLYVCDMNGRVIWGRCVDSVGAPLKLIDFNPENLGSNHPLIMSKVTFDDTGIWLTERGPMMVSAKPVLDSRGKGPVRGTVILGRMLQDLADENDQYLQDIKKWTKVDFELCLAKGDMLERSQGISIHDLASQPNNQPIVREDKDHADLQLLSYRALNDIRGDPAVVVIAKVKRNITAEGSTAGMYAMVSTVISGLVMLIVLLWLLQNNVLGPIAKLTAHAVEIGHNDDTTKKLALDRKDEIGILSREFDSMLDKLAQSRAALVKAARHAGMSEIATGVLHNVGNVLNSVNVSATLVAEKSRGSGIGDLKMAMDAVRESAGDLAAFLAKDPRGEHLYPLLAALTDQIADEQEGMQREVRRLTEGIDHIKLLIQSQQSYAGHSGVLETTSIADQVEAALAMTQQTVSGETIEVVREFEALPSCKVDRHRLMEIIVNLLHNAHQALHEPTVTTRRLTLRVKGVGENRVAVEVEDSGVGIASENLARIFTHGFTTKKNGHGFGLHASANAATEMGGSLSGHSDGPGRGARFTLEFPVKSLSTTAVAS